MAPREFRLAVYRGGLEPGLRKIAWKHLLNLYPAGLTGGERLAYLKEKSRTYTEMKSDWMSLVLQGRISDDVKTVMNMVRKDVLRTDRQHAFFAGEGNPNVTTLFNILTTYALNHQSVSYCQGMSDLASPLLVTIGEEAHTYLCFVALMQRLKPNFLLDGVAMTTKFQHLSEGLMYYDPEFYTYLKLHHADDLLFCYRWLLLEMKRKLQTTPNFLLSGFLLRRICLGFCLTRSGGNLGFFAPSYCRYLPRIVGGKVGQDHPPLSVFLMLPSGSAQ